LLTSTHAQWIMFAKLPRDPTPTYSELVIKTSETYLIMYVIEKDAAAVKKHVEEDNYAKNFC